MSELFPYKLLPHTGVQCFKYFVWHVLLLHARVFPAPDVSIIHRYGCWWSMERKLERPMDHSQPFSRDRFATSMCIPTEAYLKS